MNIHQMEALLKTTRPPYVEPRIFGLLRWAVVGALVGSMVILIALK